MYILPESVKRRVLRRYRRRSRDIVVDNRFRGWAWEYAPIDPPYDILLTLSDLVGRYCRSMRDIYLKYVENQRKPTNAKMIEGSLYHQTIAKVIEQAKRTMYCQGDVTGESLGAAMTALRDTIVDDIVEKRGAPDILTRGGKWEPSRIRENMKWLWDYQVNQIVAAVTELSAGQPYIGLDALVNTAIPVVVEQRLDGRNLGLSGHLSADAFGSEGVVLDVKTGKKRQFHRLATTGYAMVIESIHEYPVDIGCIVYCWFGDELPPRIEYDVHTIDEPLRQEFLELRDDAMKLVFDHRDPGLPERCYEDCSYWGICH